MATKKTRKKKSFVVIFQFTMKGNLYRVGDTFKGTKAQSDLLINKNYLKWQ
jgi:hypothetical protein